MSVNVARPGLFEEAKKGSAESKKRKRFELKGGDLPLLLWVILFGFGGGLLSLYYASIGYFPDIEWQESLVYLGSLTLVGFFLFLVYGLLLFLPGWIWSEFLLTDSHLKKIFFYIEEREELFCVKSTFLYLAAPFLVFMAAVHAFLIFESTRETLNLTVLSAVALAVVSGWVWRRFQILCRTEGLDCGSRHLVRYVALFTLSAALGFLALLIIHWSSTTDVDKLMPWICTVVVVAMNLFVAVLFHTHQRESIALAIVSALSLLVLGDLIVKEKESKMSARIMSSFGLGYERPVDLLVKRESTEILDGLEIGYLCTKPGNFLKVQSIEVLSRLGDNYFLRADKKRNFLFPKKMVISWAVDDVQATGGQTQQPGKADSRTMPCPPNPESADSRPAIHTRQAGVQSPPQQQPRQQTLGSGIQNSP
jgi:hypothetical protein